jgi:cellobiose phosphorylase
MGIACVSLCPAGRCGGWQPGRLAPCIPRHWPGYEVTYRHGSARYRIRVENPARAGRGVGSVLADRQAVPGGTVPLRDDGREHDVRIVSGHGKR